MQLGRRGFGIQERKTPKPVTPNHREIKRLRGELRSLRKQFKRGTEQEKIGLSELRDIIRKKLKSLTTAERLRKGRKSRERDREQRLSPTHTSSPKPCSVMRSKEE